MHSSIISKIRILKPRKKAAQTSKSFTIKNFNFNSSSKEQNLKSTEESPPPPLVHKNILEDESIKKTTDQSQKWLPVYIVNVPKSGLVKVSKSGSETVTKNSGSGNTLKTTCNNDEFDLTNKKNLSGHTLVYANIENTKKTLMSGGICTVPSKIQASNEGKTNEKLEKPHIQNKNELAKTTKPVSCFLCSLTYESVSEMQSHYLESHKQKKRSTTVVDTSNRSASVPSKYFNKPIKSKELFDGTRTDPSEGEPKCPICSIDFNTEEEVKEHMTSVHCYKCSECKNIFYTLFQFTDHRCNLGNKLKKTRLKKKKLKIKLPKTGDKDPLSLSPKSNTIIHKNYVKCNLGTWPISVPAKPQPKLPQSNFSSTSIVKQNLLTDNANNSIKGSFINLTNKNKSVSDDSSQSCALKFTNNSLMNYSLDELTSKEFNRMKLTEIMQNPYLSVKFIKKTKASEKVKSEFFSCGRCNVLCEDKNDYTDHLEECLRLSNVSLFSSQGPPKRIIKLKSEVIRKKICNSTKTSINQKLLTELKNYIDANNHDLFQGSESINNCLMISKGKYNEKPRRPNQLFHPDIKGDISIRKIDKSMSKINLCKSGSISTGNCKQPMVVIPIDKSFETNVSKSLPVSDDSSYQTMHKHSVVKVEDHYPEISIIDKSNCVTYKFTGSGTDPELRYDPNLQRSDSPCLLHKENGNFAINVVKFNNMSGKLEKSSPIMSLPHSQDKVAQSALEVNNMLFKQSLPLKSEPSTSLQPHVKVVCNPDSEEYEQIEEKYSSSLELILDEEEIKMEVEDEIVDDCF